MRTIFPEAWRDFVGQLPENERTDLLSNYYRRLIDRNPDIHRPAARAWSRYEAACSTLYPTARAPFESDHGGFALALARIEAHYFAHGTFLPEGWPWADIDRVRQLPCTIVQGRYDIVCPPVTAEALSRAWPEAHYIVVADAGHSALEPGIRAALVNATENSPPVAERRRSVRAALPLGSVMRKPEIGDLMDTNVSFELPPEQIGPAAWYGPEMSRSTEWLMPLSAAEVAEVDAAARKFVARDGRHRRHEAVGLRVADAGPQAQGPRRGRGPERPRLPADARPAGRALDDARGGHCVLWAGRPSRQRALAERQGPCAGPRAGSRPRLGRSQRAHLPDA